MTTTSTTSSTAASATTTATTQSVTQSAAQSLLTSLGSGSGIDTTTLVGSLVTASFAARSSALQTQQDALTAQVSGVSTLRNAVATFNKALGTLVTGGTLTTQPVSSSPAVLTATALPGAKLAGLSTSVTVQQLAAAQTAVSATPFTGSSASVGTGTLTLAFGQATYDGSGAMTAFTAGNAAAITIDITDGSLDKIAAAINAKKAGVTATVVTDAGGSAYLSLKGATGKDQAFTLSSTSTSGDLSALNVGVGASATRLTSNAQNARLSVDGVSVERTTNSVSDLVTGAKLQLNAVSAVPVSLTSTTPTDALKNAVNDFVDTYNEVMKLVTDQTDPITGPLRSDTAANALRTQLQGLTRKVLAPDAAAGDPATLASIGVRTNKDGTLEVSADALTKALTDTPAAVEALFAYSSTATSGISAALNSLNLTTSSTIYGLGASATKYAVAQSDASKASGTLDDQKAAMTTRLTQQFASMSSRVAAYKSTQSFLTNQIAAWNKSTG